MTRLDAILRGQLGLPGWVKAVATMWMLFAMAPIFATSFGFWPLVSAQGYPGILAVILLCGMISFVMFLALMRPATPKTMPARHLADFGRFMVAFLMALFAGYSAGTGTLPLAAAVLSGHRVEAVVTIEDGRAGSTARCRNPVRVAEMRPLFSSICDLSSPLREQLQPGTLVVVSGWGMGSAILADGVRLAER
ncbi:hypothetical protein [Paracoccus sp. NSM]|uniref:hypothetical protein n=1 Tax=Paracoccus sp. NSM TaxID=3457784 RepID=UPI004036AD0C